MMKTSPGISTASMMEFHQKHMCAMPNMTSQEQVSEQKHKPDIELSSCQSLLFSHVHGWTPTIPWDFIYYLPDEIH